MTALRLLPSLPASPASNLIVVGTADRLRQEDVAALLPESVRAVLLAEVEKAETGLDGTVVQTLGSGDRARISLGVLPAKFSRHNSPTRGWAITHVLGRTNRDKSQETDLVLALEDADHLLGSALAVARAFPLFLQRKKTPETAEVRVVALAAGGALTDVDAANEAMTSVRLAARLVDTPPQVMDAAQLAGEARQATESHPHVSILEIVGDDLLTHGLGGIHAVGRIAPVAPRMIVLDYNPPGAEKTIGLVGKGIVYDTGGMNLKISGHMAHMKMDMGGAAAMLGAFRTLVATDAKVRVVTALMCAENAIGPGAYRPDDILVLHSGKTVEINNTDAEGRLGLGDGVSYLARNYPLDALFNAATLTGAQLVSTGKRHAAVVSNDEELELLAVATGKATGDLVAPLPFCPEFFKREFSSQVADMKNSVKDRANGQSSCAAQFVYNHIDDLEVRWLHIDLAGPAWADERGTGYGVGLVSEMIRSLAAS